MRYLFVIQGEGRGHMTQAITMANILREAGHLVEHVMVGKCSNRELPQFFIEKIGAEITTFDSPAIDYGRKGKKGNMMRSVLLNAAPSKVVKWMRSISTISRTVKRSEADVVINFYDMLLGVSALLGQVRKPIINIAHQYLIHHSDYPLRGSYRSERATLAMMNRMCSFRSRKILALSLYPLQSCRNERVEVVPPLLRSEIFSLRPTDEKFILGYMLNPAYIDDILEWKKSCPETQVHLFWDKKDEPELKEHCKGLWMHRINDSLFLDMMSRCSGYITTAGFESVCEAAYLGKPIVMIPSHIEQQLNAADAAKARVGIESERFDLERLIEYIPHHDHPNEEFRKWVDSAKEIYIKILTSI
ncbi:MAG: glycosyltransferase family protein [Rikenellaceae bacterium]